MTYEEFKEAYCRNCIETAEKALKMPIDRVDCHCDEPKKAYETKNL